MRIVAKYQPDGGWKCIIRSTPGEECRTDVMARRDMETHLLIDHAIKEIRPLDMSMDMYDVSDLLGDMLNSGGAI
jgi:hypothetical protein